MGIPSSNSKCGVATSDCSCECFWIQPCLVCLYEMSSLDLIAFYSLFFSSGLFSFSFCWFLFVRPQGSPSGWPRGRSGAGTAPTKGQSQRRERPSRSMSTGSSTFSLIHAGGEAAGSRSPSNLRGSPRTFPSRR